MKPTRYPIHCAASSGNIELLRWLIDTHKCPYRYSVPRLRSSVTKRNQHGNHDIDTSIVSPTLLIPTSNGRTILDLPLENDHADILQYLTKEKRILLPSQNLKSDNDSRAKNETAIICTSTKGGGLEDNLSMKSEDANSQGNLSLFDIDITSTFDSILDVSGNLRSY